MVVWLPNEAQSLPFIEGRHFLFEKELAPLEKTRKLIAIDDDPSLLESLRHIFKGDFEVTACSKSLEAMDVLRKAPPDVILLDIRMPGLEGTDLLQLIKKAFPLVPVIILSAYVNDKNAKYYTSLGAFDVVAKPFDAFLLRSIVDHAIGDKDTIPIILDSLILQDARDQVYRKLIITALHKVSWNQKKAAELLGISRYCLIRWIKKLQIVY